MKYLQTLSSPCFIQVFRTSTSTSRAVSPAPVSRWRVSLAASQTGTGALRQAEPGRQAAGQADRQAGTKMSLIIRRRRGSSSADGHHTTTGHMDTGDAGHCTCRQPFVRVYWNHWLVCEKKGKNKKNLFLDKFLFESCMKCRCVGRWKTFLEFPCLLSTRAYHRFPYFVF